MAETPAASDQGPDWFIDLNEPVPERRTDARLRLAAEAVRAAHARPRSGAAATKDLEDAMRDRAFNGMTRDEIAEQCSFTVKQVDHVLAGGKLFDSADA